MEIIDKLIKQKEQLDSLKPYSSEAIRAFIEDVELKFIYHSNAIAGNNMTLAETKQVLDEHTIGGKPLAEHLEIINQKAAIDYIINLADNKADLTEDNLKWVNYLLLDKIDIKNAGKFIENDEYIKQKILDFFSWYNKNKDKCHPVELAAIISIELNKVKPFISNNGKTIRLILNLELLKNDYPLTIIGVNGTEKCTEALKKSFAGNNDDYINLLGSYVLRSFNKYFDIIANRNWEDKNYEHEFVL